MGEMIRRCIEEGLTGIKPNDGLLGETVREGKKGKANYLGGSQGDK
jgi:hypothetical protein